MKRYLKPIYCMAISRKDLATKLYQVSGDLLDHLALYYLSDSDETCHHWASEIFAFLHSVPVIKCRNKLPDAKFIYGNTFEVWHDSLIRHIYALCKEHGVFYDPTKLGKILEFADKYFQWLSQSLSTSGIVTSSQVYEILKILKSESL